MIFSYFAELLRKLFKLGKKLVWFGFVLKKMAKIGPNWRIFSLLLPRKPLVFQVGLVRPPNDSQILIMDLSGLQGMYKGLLALLEHIGEPDPFWAVFIICDECPQRLPFGLFLDLISASRSDDHHAKSLPDLKNRRFTL